MDLSAQLTALAAEARRQAEWDQTLFSALADYQAQVAQARTNLATRIGQAVSQPAPSVPASPPPPPLPFDAEEAENMKWQNLRRGLNA